MASRTGSAFEAEDMVEVNSGSDDGTTPSNGSRRSLQHFEIGSARSHDLSDDDDDKSVDSAIGREYDDAHTMHDHDHIRQEALRMLEVADADAHYSVHRTITGGFAAHAKPLGNQRRTKTALQGLNFIANRKQQQPRYSNFSTTGSSRASREEYEYGDESVVDVIGLEARSASAAAAVEGGGGNSWSSRYSIDSTMLAMSGGAMKQKLDRMDRENNSSSKSERFSAANLFGSSPATKSPQIFGSGFSFRQQHVFGKQNVTMPTDNLHSARTAEATLGSPTPRVKTWQEQLLVKKQQQRRWLICICLALLCFIVPLASIWGVQRSRINKNSSSNNAIPIDGDHGSVTFYVTSDAPYNTEEEVKLKHDLAAVSQITSFAVHLGNIQDPALTKCNSTNYSKVATLIENSSPVTVFVVPGEEDWNNCPDPAAAWDSWEQNFDIFDTRWEDTPNAQEFTVFRQKDQLENWAFLHEGVLFVGVHVVNGKVPDQAEFDERNNRNYRWVMGMCKEHNEVIRAVVIFGNAKPGYAPNVRFFAPLELFWKTYDKPALYVHASTGKGDTGQYKPYSDLPHVMALQVENSIKNPPLKINVGFGDEPFIFG